MTPSPREILAQNRRDAIAFAERTGIERLSAVLRGAEADLVARLAALRLPPGTFSRDQMLAALAQVRAVAAEVGRGMTGLLADGAETAAERATEGTIDYLSRVEASFRGIVAPLDLDAAAMFERARVGARSSVLRRLASSGEGAPGSPAAEHPAKEGILRRYSLATIGDFEGDLQKGMLSGKSWAEQRSDLVAKSPFLAGKPRFWAERIVRTESMGAYARGSWEATREADDQLGDMLKVLSATFDDRTAADSYAVHGQIRRPDEAFESWYGLYQHPPNRPNDREVVVPHRMSWPLPDYLRWKADAEVEQRWRAEKRKGSPPPRPKMTTVDAEKIGRTTPPKIRDVAPGRAAVPPEE